jgi:competence protein ComEC
VKKIVIAIFLFIYLVFPLAEYQFDSNLHIWVLDIGQGDATLIRTPDKKHILVDTGPSDKLFPELGKILPFWLRTIDYVVITHPHQDHLGMLKDLEARYEIKKIIWYELDYFNPIFAWTQEQKKTKPDLFIEYFSGQTLSFGDFVLHFVYPESSTPREISNVNNASVFFVLTYGDFVGVFTGDAEEEEEREVVPLLKEMRIFSLQKNVYLKAGHHCSDTSSSLDLLKVINADITTCSLGENLYGHPSKETLAKFKDFNIKYYRTDLEGTIEISTNGRGYKVESE